MSALVNFLQHPFRKGKKQKGVTFLEILAVLVILVLIYLAYARSFGQGTDKAKLSDVQNSFKQYQLGFESAMNENSGLPTVAGVNHNVDYSAVNNYIQADYKLANTTSGDATTVGATQPVANPVKDSNYKDPWKTAFKVQPKWITDSHYVLVVRSYGKDKLTSNTADAFAYSGAGNDVDDVLMVTDYNNGMVKTCTEGLSKDLGAITPATGTITGCQ